MLNQTGTVVSSPCDGMNQWGKQLLMDYRQFDFHDQRQPIEPSGRCYGNVIYDNDFKFKDDVKLINESPYMWPNEFERKI